MCAKLEMMQHEQEKKKGNEEEWLKALVREHVGKLVKQLEEKEVARLQEYQQSLEEWLEERMCREIEERMCREIERQKRSQREFKLTIAGQVDKFLHASETKVTTVLEKCEAIAEQLRKYESLLKFDDQRPQLEQERPEQGQPPQKQREAPEELHNEAEKLADNDLCDKAASWQTLYQREKIEVSEGTDRCRGPNEGEPSGVATDT